VRGTVVDIPGPVGDNPLVENVTHHTAVTDPHPVVTHRLHRGGPAAPDEGDQGAI